MVGGGGCETVGGAGKPMPAELSPVVGFIFYYCMLEMFIVLKKQFNNNKQQVSC